MKTSGCLFLLGVLLLTSMASVAESPGSVLDWATLDATITAQMSKHGLPGVALAVVEGAEITYLKGYGTAGTHAMPPQTQMFIGSQSKSFTALVMAQLAEQGQLDLNAPVQTYLPWFKVADTEASARITLHHLLHHTSGLSEAGYGVVLPPNATSEEAVRSLASARLTAPIGAKFQYFNLGYDVLAFIIETVTGQRYADVVRAQVFDPLGMTRSTADPATATDLAQGYSRLFGFTVPMRQVVREYEIGAGYIVSTAEDLARYAIAMNHGAVYNGARLLSPESAGRFFIPGLGDYALGWQVVDNGARIFHGGANETFRTDIVLYPQRDRAFVLLVNVGHLTDHYISTPQLTQSVEALVLGGTPPAVSEGWSVRWPGWGMGLLVLALLVLHTYNFYQLKGWSARAQRLSPTRKLFELAISFILPTVILLIVFSQMKAFFGYRFNLLTTLTQFHQTLPDVFILMLVGTLPDYVQGLMKLWWGWTAGRGQPQVQRTVVQAHG